MSAASKVDQALRDAGLRIVGVSIGKKDDKKTWRVDWPGKPTDGQMSQAQKVMGNLDLDSMPEPASTDPLEDIRSRLKALESRLPLGDGK